MFLLVQPAVCTDAISSSANVYVRLAAPFLLEMHYDQTWFQMHTQKGRQNRQPKETQFIPIRQILVDCLSNCPRGRGQNTGISAFLQGKNETMHLPLMSYNSNMVRVQHPNNLQHARMNAANTISLLHFDLDRLSFFICPQFV